MSDDLDDILPAPVTPKLPGKRHKKLLHVGENPETLAPEMQEILITIPDEPAPVFHDTDLENHVDDDLSIVNTGLKNMVQGWNAVRTIADMVKLNREINTSLADRRRLANKQLGTKETGGGGNIYQIKD